MIRLLQVGRRDERGVAMVMVIGLSTVMLLLVAVAVTAALGGMRQARTTQDWGAALAAAYAGVEEYQSRLANDSSYQLYGNPASTFTADTVSLPPASDPNPAFGLGTTGTWATMVGSDGVASFRYEVDSSSYAGTGRLSLRSTGRVGNETRTIVAELKQQGFIDFLYFTDYEIQDPALSEADVATCVRYAWAGRPATGCSDIAFGSNDVVKGPVHSNDAIRICEARFEGPVTTAYNPASGAKYIKKNSSNSACSGQEFVVPGSPSYSPVIGMPTTNSEMRKETRSDLTTSGVPNPGCLYTGPTKIVLNGNGTMTVRSPWSKATQTTGNPANNGSAPPMCGIVGTASGQLGHAGGAVVPVPENNLIFVQNVPVADGDPNYRADGTMPASLQCVGESGSRNPTGLSSPAKGNGIGYPTNNERSPSLSSYGCRNGDVFVQGTLNGHLTIAAENYIYITGNITYADSQDDILGLVGNNAVWIWNPIDRNSDSILGNTGRRIDAAILSVAHTFQLQNKSEGGARGILTINGALAQKFRGIVNGSGNGYTKNYVYDPRLQYTAPPKFLSPVTTTYGVSVWVEVAPIFAATGEYR